MLLPAAAVELDIRLDEGILNFSVPSRNFDQNKSANTHQDEIPMRHCTNTADERNVNGIDRLLFVLMRVCALAGGSFVCNELFGRLKTTETTKLYSVLL